MSATKSDQGCKQFSNGSPEPMEYFQASAGRRHSRYNNFTQVSITRFISSIMRPCAFDLSGRKFELSPMLLVGSSIVPQLLETYSHRLNKRNPYVFEPDLGLRHALRHEEQRNKNNQCDIPVVVCGKVPVGTLRGTEGETHPNSHWGRGADGEHSTRIIR